MKRRRSRRSENKNDDPTQSGAEQQPEKRTRSARKPRAVRVETKTPQRVFLRGTNLQPPGTRVVACLAGSKQSILVDMLHRKEGATMPELLEALAGGRRSWTEATVRSGFGWDMKLKGYGVRSTFDEDMTERFHLVVPRGQRVPKHAATRTRRSQ